ncbi:N-acetyltransferase family protein [Chitinophagaceae bacterium MMS25-I14]
MNVHTIHNGDKIIIRRPHEADAAGIISYAKLLFAATDQVLTTLEEYTITLEQEKAWINNGAQPGSIILIAEYNNEVIGLLNFSVGLKKKNAHAGEFGVSVHPDYQGMGIGRALIETLLEWAKENPLVEKVYLQVFSTNHRAINLYKDLGFIEEGRFIKAVKQPSGEYVDLFQMYVEVK